MKLRYFGLFTAAAMLAACDGPLDVDPKQSIPQDDALRTAEEIRAGANAMYDALQGCDGGYCRNLLIFPDMYADNLSFTGTFTTDREVALRSIAASNGAVAGIWGVAYDGINRANNVLAAIPNVEQLPAAEAAMLEGEARFIRALNYFNLVKFFGGVPISTAPTSEVGPDVNLPRSTAAEVWTLIEADLNAAIPLLGTGRNSGAARANRWAARALLARAHLYQREWQQAYNQADSVIENGPYELMDTYAEVFESEQTAEAIMEVPFTINDSNALAFWFFPSSLGGRRGFAPTASLVNSFGADDSRIGLATSGTASAFGLKFTDIVNLADDVPVLRLAEMYLIRSEAAARLGMVDDALDDINVIRERAGVDPRPLVVNDTTGAREPVTQTSVLEWNLEERRRELFYEGHRFFDLRRFMDVASVGAYMNSLGLTGSKLLFPIPQREMDANSELTQNPGY